MSPTSRIHDLVRSGEITPEHGAVLLERNREARERALRNGILRSVMMPLCGVALAVLAAGLLFLTILHAGGCAGEPERPYDGPLWGDSCVSVSNAPNVATGCSHADDGSGLSHRQPRSNGICEQGACRPFCPCEEGEEKYRGGVCFCVPGAP